jgi:opacity protein-like surface antigen
LRKPLILILSMAVLAVGPASLGVAQAGDAKPVHFGVVAGLNLAKLAFDPEVPGSDLKMRTAFQAGVMVDYSVSPMIAIGTGLNYSMKGVKSSVTEEGVDVDLTTKLSYFTIPALVKFRFGTETGPRPFLMVGPELGLLLSAKEKGEASGGRASVSAEVDVKDYFETLDFGVLGGAGVEMPLTPQVTGLVQAGYDLGLMDVSKESTVAMPAKAEDANATVKNRTIFISVGLKF